MFSHWLECLSVENHVPFIKLAISPGTIANEEIEVRAELQFMVLYLTAHTSGSQHFINVAVAYVKYKRLCIHWRNTSFLWMPHPKLSDGQ